MLYNLKMLLKENNIKYETAAKILNISVKAFQNKVNEKTDFTYPEVTLLHDVLFPQYTLEYVFKSKSSA